MGSMVALVVEDEASARAKLLQALHRTRCFACIDVVAQSEAMARVGSAVDVAFIPLPAPDLRLVYALLAQSQAPAVVLTTRSAGDARAHLDSGAVDYLLKPFTDERVYNCVARLRQQRSVASPPPRLAARHGADVVFLDVDGLWAFEATDRLIMLHHCDGLFSVDLSLRALSVALGERVLRVHRNWLVAAAHVRGLSRIDGELTLAVGALPRVPVSRERAPAIRHQLLQRTVGLRR